MINRFIFAFETGRAIRHKALTLCGADCRTEVGFVGSTHLAGLALRSVEEDYVVAFLDASH